MNLDDPAADMAVFGVPRYVIAMAFSHCLDAVTNLQSSCHARLLI
jgi:hypothetical protein